MTADIKNTAASVRSRLYNAAKKEQKPFDSLLLLYMLERLLYRLSLSEYEDKFVLKGGLLMFILTDFKGRPTKDMDLLAQQISNDMENIKYVFSKICAVDYENDGLMFDKESITVEEIKKEAEYQGVRVNIMCYLGNARKRLQLDIGFGDIVIPKPEFMECPTILDMEAPNIKVYSLESIISEKFHAMIVLSIANSRMKDFYDIFTLLTTNSFDGRKLQEAVFETLQRRHTILEKEIVLFDPEFSRDEKRNIMWKAFLNKMNAEFIPFEEVTRSIIAFLKPVYDSIINEEEFFMQWDNKLKRWDKCVTVNAIKGLGFVNISHNKHFDKLQK